MYPNRLTSTGKLDSRAMPDGSLSPILLGRMDISMVADDTDLKASAATIGGWSFDHANSTIKKYTDSFGDAYARGVYPDMTVSGTATPSIFFTFKNSTAPQEFYVQFYARRLGTGGGSKWLKCHDKNDGISPYSNVTFNNTYQSSNLSVVGFGNGETPTNDAQKVVWHEAGHDDTGFIRYPSNPANVLPLSIEHGATWSSDDWGDGTQWKKFQYRLKMNTGTSAETEVNDGAYEIRVDDVLKLRITNFMNRSYGSQGIGYLEFMSLSQSPGAAAFSIEMKKITVSENGWVD